MVLSNKGDVLTKANEYAAALASAAGHCEAAARAMLPVQSDVAENWQGNSGAAMEQKLDDLRFQINQIYAKFTAAGSQAKHDGRSVYNNWPEENTED